MAELKKSLGTIRLTLFGIGTTIGGGIYSVIGVAAGQADYSLWISLIVAAIAAGLSALSYAELASSFPNAGAEFIFVSRAFPKTHTPNFLTGWLIAFHSAATTAAVLLAFSGYFTAFIKLPELIISYSLLVLLTLFNITGIKKSSTINIILVSAQLLGLLILVAGIFLAKKSIGPQTFSFDLDPGVFAATATLFFIYTGFEHMAALGSEVKNPGKNIPKAYLFTVLATTVFYILIGAAIFQVAKPNELAGTNSPLTLAAGNVGPQLAMVIGVAALLATANASFSGIISVSRLLYGMAVKGEMPGSFAKLNKNKAPWVTSLVVAALAGAFLLFGEIKTVAGMSSLGALMVFVMVNISLIRLRYIKPDLERPFRVPLSIGKMPLLPILAILVCLALITQYDWKIYVVFTGVVVVGLILHKLLKHQPKEGLSEKDEADLFKH